MSTTIDSGNGATSRGNTMDSLEWAAALDATGSKPTQYEKGMLIAEHNVPHTPSEDTEGMGWVEFYTWLGY